MYQRVQRVECSSPRPVLLLGPLVEASKDLLVTENPTKFCRCLPGELRCTLLRPKTKIYIQHSDTLHVVAMALIFSPFCVTEIMKASQQAIERGVKDCVFIDYKRRSGHFDVTTVASIKEITEKVYEADCRILLFSIDLCFPLSHFLFKLQIFPLLCLPFKI